MADQMLVLITDDEATDDEAGETTEGTKGWASKAAGAVTEKVKGWKRVELPIAELETKMESFLSVVGQLFRKADQQVTAESGMRLKEVELQVEISGEGEIRMVAGGKAAAKGAITLRFERVESD